MRVLEGSSGVQAEAWERIRDRMRARVAAVLVRRPEWGPRLARARVWALWAALGLLLVLVAVSPQYRRSLGVYVSCFWILIVWFVLARAKTLTWVGLARVFSAGVVWSWVIAWVSYRLAGWAGLTALDVGARTAIAALTEESLKLLPVLVVVVVAPGRVRRFAAVDWLLMGLAAGLGFQAWEDLTRRLGQAVTRPGLLDFLAPGQGPGSGFPQYGWGPLSGGSGEWGGQDVYGYAGHHVFTALVTAAVGLGVAAWRHSTRPNPASRPEQSGPSVPSEHALPSGTVRAWRRWGWRAGAVLLPCLAWLLVVVNHFGYNAILNDSSWLDAEQTSSPWLLRAVWTVTGRGTGTGWLLLLVLLGCLLVDAARLQRAGPVTDLPLAVDSPDNTVGNGDSTSGDGGRSPAESWIGRPRFLVERWAASSAMLGAPPGVRAMLRAVAALVVHTGRDLGFVLAAHTRDRSEQPSGTHPGQALDPSGAGDGGPVAQGVSRRDLITRGRAAAVLLRQVRTQAYESLLPGPGPGHGPARHDRDPTATDRTGHARLWPQDSGARRRVRLLALVALGAIALVGLVLAMLLARRIGTDLTPTTSPLENLFGWLAGQFDTLAQWWAARSTGEKLLIGAGIAALVALSGGSLGLALGVSGAAVYTADHARGAATFTRNPAAATRSWLNTTTPAAAALDVGEFVLTFVPGSAFGALTGRSIRAGAGEFARDPDAWRAAHAARRGSDTGTVRFDDLGNKRANTWPEILRDWREGVKFNTDQAHRYGANEITLGNGKRLDSYTHGADIVSRKNSQLADLEPSTAAQYLREHTTKYSPGELIADTARARQHFPHLIGEELNGNLILEVPVQARAVPEDILQLAQKLKISIRDITGHVHKIPIPPAKVTP